MAGAVPSLRAQLLELLLQPVDVLLEHLDFESVIFCLLLPIIKTHCLGGLKRYVAILVPILQDCLCGDFLAVASVGLLVVFASHILQKLGDSFSEMRESSRAFL